MFTQDVRLSRTFSPNSEGMPLALLGEFFNLNAANLAGYGGDIANFAQFGQPGERTGDVAPISGSPQGLLV